MSQARLVVWAGLLLLASPAGSALGDAPPSAPPPDAGEACGGAAPSWSAVDCAAVARGDAPLRACVHVCMDSPGPPSAPAIPRVPPPPPPEPPRRVCVGTSCLLLGDPLDPSLPPLPEGPSLPPVPVLDPGAPPALPPAPRPDLPRHVCVSSEAHESCFVVQEPREWWPDPPSAPEFPTGIVPGTWKGVPAPLPPGLLAPAGLLFTWVSTGGDGQFTIACAAPNYVNCNVAAAFAVSTCFTMPVTREPVCNQVGGGGGGHVSNLALDGGSAAVRVIFSDVSTEFNGCVWAGGSGSCVAAVGPRFSACTDVQASTIGGLRGRVDLPPAVATPLLSAPTAVASASPRCATDGILPQGAAASSADETPCARLAGEMDALGAALAAVLPAHALGPAQALADDLEAGLCPPTAR